MFGGDSNLGPESGRESISQANSGCFELKKYYSSYELIHVPVCLSDTYNLYGKVADFGERLATLDIRRGSISFTLCTDTRMGI